MDYGTRGPSKRSRALQLQPTGESAGALFDDTSPALCAAATVGNASAPGHGVAAIAGVDVSRWTTGRTNRVPTPTDLRDRRSILEHRSPRMDRSFRLALVRVIAHIIDAVGSVRRSHSLDSMMLNEKTVVCRVCVGS